MISSSEIDLSFELELPLKRRSTKALEDLLKSLSNNHKDKKTKKTILAELKKRRIANETNDNTVRRVEAAVFLKKLTTDELKVMIDDGINNGDNIANLLAEIDCRNKENTNDASSSGSH